MNIFLNVNEFVNIKHNASERGKMNIYPTAPTWCSCKPETSDILLRSIEIIGIVRIFKKCTFTEYECNRCHNMSYIACMTLYRELFIYLFILLFLKNLNDVQNYFSELITFQIYITLIDFNASVALEKAYYSTFLLHII